MSALSLIVGLGLLAPLLLLDTVFLAETLAGLNVVHPSAPDRSPAPSVAILVPAHNEAANLQPHLDALRRLSPSGARLLVVADNCADETALVARESRAEVVERHDPTRRGKGYALDFGRARLATTMPPDIVIVLDADCAVEAGALARLAARAAVEDRAVQAAYLFRPAPDAGPMVQVSNFAFAVKNRVRQRGGARIGAAAILTGSGMAMPWTLFRDLPLATGEVVEDLALGLHMVRAGRPPVYEDAAVVWSEASSAAGTQTQRARWEGGFLGIARRHALPLLGEGMRRRSWTRLWMGLHLLTPPLTLLLALNGAATALLGLAWLLGLPAAPALVALAALAAVVGSVAGAWIVVGRDQLPAAGLLRLPAYFLWKATLHVRLLSGRQRVTWTRTERVDPPKE